MMSRLMLVCWSLRGQSKIIIMRSGKMFKLARDGRDAMAHFHSPPTILVAHIYGMPIDSIHGHDGFI
jgi:hypothetical protein